MKYVKEYEVIGNKIYMDGVEATVGFYNDLEYIDLEGIDYEEDGNSATIIYESDRYFTEAIGICKNNVHVGDIIFEIKQSINFMLICYGDSTLKIDSKMEDINLVEDMLTFFYESGAPLICNLNTLFDVITVAYIKPDEYDELHYFMTRPVPRLVM